MLDAPRPAQKLVHIHAGAEELGRVYVADLLVQASMACAAKALETLAALAAPHWAGQAASAHADYNASLLPSPLDPAVSRLDLGLIVQTNESSTLLHLKLPVEVSSSRTAIGAIRSAARARISG